MTNKNMITNKVIVPEIVTSTSCNEKVLHMCMVRTYHERFQIT